MIQGTRAAIGPYRRVLAQPVLRRVLPALLASALGDGMSLVAVAWLAVQLAPPAQAGYWTGLAVAAYALPATLGAVVLGRLVRGLPGSRLVAVDASLRAVALGTIAVLAVAGWLSPITYVALLAGSSLLHAWGSAGTYTLIAEQLPEDDRVAGNALVSTFTQAAIVVGPALAGGLTAWLGAGWVIGADAASFAALAVSCWLVPARLLGRAGPPSRPGPGPAPETAPRVPAMEAVAETTERVPVVDTAARVPAVETAEPVPATARGGWRTIAGQPQLLGLLGVTWVFFFLYGPVEVALPVHVARELSGSPGLLGLFWAVFGVGAVIGGLSADRLRNRPLWAVVVGIIVGWGIALLPLGLSNAVPAGLVGLAVGGLIYGPFTAITTALFQRASRPEVLSRVLATRTAFTVPATALGTLLGGPVVAAVGGRRTLLLSALLTIALGIVVTVVLAMARRRRRPAAS